MNYRLIALDMDGTVLNSEKKITPKTEESIHHALANGREVMFCTGRSLAEMKEYIQKFPDMRYFSMESGALLYDAFEKKFISQIRIPLDIASTLRDSLKHKDIMPQIFSEGRSLINREQYDVIEKYHMEVYRELYRTVSTFVEDPFDTVLSEQASIEKINFYHVNVEDRLDTLHYLEALHLPITMIFSEKTSLEITAPGVDKSTGIHAVADAMNASADSIIMVGDAYNDIPGMQAAGLGIAMGNANDDVKKVADVCVADNDHDGVAEAIENYLL